jgi:hypothetical protein
LEVKLVWAKSPSLAPSPVKIEAQHGDAVARQRLGDAAGGEDILRAGEAMGEQGEGPRFARRQFETAGQRSALRAGECELLEASRHRRAPRPCHAWIAA